jgi:hypothetical protein
MTSTKMAQQRGIVLPLVGLALSVLLGFAGLGIDVVYLEYWQQQQQAARRRSNSVCSPPHWSSFSWASWISGAISAAAFWPPMLPTPAHSSARKTS